MTVLVASSTMCAHADRAPVAWTKPLPDHAAPLAEPQSAAAPAEPAPAPRESRAKAEPDRSLAEADARLVREYAGRRALATLRGEASYYSDVFEGRSTASGEAYRAAEFTAAHRTLAFGTIVRVQRLDTKQVVYVRINDRGPFGKRDRIIDLSRAAAERLGMLRAGVVPVRVEILEYGKVASRR
jgi:rare lipoprotein A